MFQSLTSTVYQVHENFTYVRTYHWITDDSILFCDQFYVIFDVYEYLKFILAFSFSVYFWWKNQCIFVNVFCVFNTFFNWQGLKQLITFYALLKCEAKKIVFFLLIWTDIDSNMTHISKQFCNFFMFARGQSFYHFWLRKQSL